MANYKPTGIKWTWLFRRNVSLLQLSLWSEGLRGKLFSPELDFHLANCLNVFVGGKGNFYFFDETDMRKKLPAIQKQILSKPRFANNLRRKADLLHMNILKSAQRMKEKNLQNLSDSELSKLFRELRKAFDAGAVLTMPAYGAEACMAKDFILYGYLSKKLEKSNLLNEINLLSVPTDATGAYLERKSFLELANKFNQYSELRKLMLLKSANEITESLPIKFPKISASLDLHIERYQWLNTEYVSPEWPKEKYVRELQIILKKEPAKLLVEHVENFNSQLSKQLNLLEELEPPRDVIRVIEALQEFMREFDWSKAYYCMAFLNWRGFIHELGRRMGCSDREVLFHTYDELMAFLSRRKKVLKSTITRRMGGFVLLMRNEKISLIGGEISEIQEVAKKEKVFEVVFGKNENLTQLKGTPASVGKARGRAKVILSIQDLHKLKHGDILVTYMTTMEYTRAFHKAAAIVTDEGGLFSHAAIVAREFKLPCIVGTKKATRVFRDGDLVEVDAEKGIVRRLR